MPRAADPAEVVALHDMRIAAKRLRYILEVTGAVLRALRRERRRSWSRSCRTCSARSTTATCRSPRRRRSPSELLGRGRAALHAAAGDAPDLDPALLKQAPHARDHAGLAALLVHLRARRLLLFDRFLELWDDSSARASARGWSTRSANAPTFTIQTALASGAVTDLEQPEAPAETRRISTIPRCTSTASSRGCDFNDRVLAARRGRLGPAARAAQVLRDLLEQPRRVLHGPRRRPAGVRRRRHRQAARGRPQPGRDDRGDRRDGARADAAPDRRASTRDLRPALAEHGIRIQTCDEVDARHREELDERFRRQIFPVLTPLAVGLGPAVPLHLQPLALARRARARPADRAGDLRAREGAEGDAAALRPDRRRAHVRAARGPDRPAPRRALPRHGDRRLRRLPGHARRRLHRRRRGRRPAARGRAGAAPAPLRRGRAGRGRRRDEPAAARAAGARARDRGGRAVRGRRACSTSRTCGTSRASPASPSCATSRGRRSPSRGCSPTRTRSPT